MGLSKIVSYNTLITHRQFFLYFFCLAFVSLRDRGSEIIIIFPRRWRGTRVCDLQWEFIFTYALIMTDDYLSIPPIDACEYNEEWLQKIFYHSLLRCGIVVGE